MTTGNTTTGSMADSLEIMIAAARPVAEAEGNISQLVDVQKLEDNTGAAWNEISIAKLTAMNVTENTILDNPQQMDDTLLTITPGMTGIAVLITDKLRRTISKKTIAQMGELAMNAIIRKMDEDGVAMLDGATTSLGGAGTTTTSGLIASAVTRISSNATEKGNPPFRAVLHGYQIKYLYDELVAGVGTYNVDKDGITARIFTEGFRGMINGAQVYEDGNITVDSSDDAKGGVFAEKGIILVRSMAPRKETERKANIGGGSDIAYIYQDYAFGERSAGNWLYEIYTDASTPTS